MLRVFVNVPMIVLLLSVSSLGAVEIRQAVNQWCPMMEGEPIDSGSYLVDYNGATYGFCCRSCVRQFNADPERWVAVINQQLAPAAAADAEPVDTASLASSPAAVSESVITPVVPVTPSAAGGDEMPTPVAGTVAASASDGDEAASPAPVEPSGSPAAGGLLALLGRFHVLVVHFPIALVLVAAGLAVWDRVQPTPPVRHAALLTTHLGAAGALVAALLGWASFLTVSYPGAVDTLSLHRWIGTAAGVVAIVASICAGARIEQPRWPVAWLVTLVLGALLVTVASHLGGEVVWGEGYPLVG